MKKVLKYSLRFLAVILGLLLLLSFGGWIYLRRHKAEVISYIKTESAKRLNGEVSIGEISVSLFHTFPKISVSLENVSIRDSLWTQHHHDLLNAPKVFASLDIFELITGHFRVSKIILENALVYLYTDSAGYDNTSIFRKRPPASNGPPEPVHYPNLEIRNSNLVVEKKNKHKLFSFDIHRLLCRVKTQPDQPQLDLDINLQAQVTSLIFNQEKGSFAEGKMARGKFLIHFNPDSKILQFDKIKLLIDKQIFTSSGKFFLAEVPALFTLSLETENLDLKKASSLLTRNISSKLNQYGISGEINRVKCSLDGTDTAYKTPLIRIQASVKNRSVHTPVMDLERASFEGFFTNEYIKGMGHDDENSVLRFTGLNANWQDMDFHSDSMIIQNLILPSIKCNVRSVFRLDGLNSLLDDRTFSFSKGGGKVDLQYSGPLVDGSTVPKTLNGSFLMDSAAFTYLPRNFNLLNGKGKIRFAASDMFIEDLHVNTGNTDLLMNGSMKNLLSLIDRNPGQLTLAWDIRSNRINLNDFKAFLKKRTGTVSKKKKKAMLSETLYQITRLMVTSSMELNLQAKQLNYKKFTATGIRTTMELNDDAITMKSLVLEHAGGSIEAHGSLRNETNSNPFSFKATLKHVDVSKVFDAFNNFGQQAIAAKNIQGSLNAGIDLKGEVTEKVLLIPDSTRGQINFNLENGRLIDFEPVQKISETVFKKRNFSDIQFADLHDLFTISGNRITIDRMEIRSTVMTMFVEGTYDVKKGADLSIQVPLSNLKNKHADVVPENQGIDSKTGVSAKLRAKTGDDHKLHISWDPFNKASRKMKKHK
ncbi:MAG: AsmA family protein [Bacteroidota bacterium]|nr:AsmA family protein [Bacteroidota bacterium]